MNISNWLTLHDSIVKNDGSGKPSDALHRIFTNIITQLQINLSDEGYIFPSQNETNINSLSGTKHIAKILYDSTNQVMKVNNDGTFKEIYTRPPQLTTTERTAIPAAQINGSWVYDTDLNKLYYGINSTWKEVAFS